MAIIRVLGIFVLWTVQRASLLIPVGIYIRRWVIWSILQPVTYCVALSLFIFTQYIFLVFLLICVLIPLKGIGDFFFHLTSFFKNFETNLDGNICHQVRFRKLFSRYCVEKCISYRSIRRNIWFFLDLYWERVPYCADQFLAQVVVNLQRKDLNVFANLFSDFFLYVIPLSVVYQRSKVSCTRKGMFCHNFLIFFSSLVWESLSIFAAFVSKTEAV